MPPKQSRSRRRSSRTDRVVGSLGSIRVRQRATMPRSRPPPAIGSSGYDVLSTHGRRSSRACVAREHGVSRWLVYPRGRGAEARPRGRIGVWPRLVVGAPARSGADVSGSRRAGSPCRRSQRTRCIGCGRLHRGVLRGCRGSSATGAAAVDPTSGDPLAFAPDLTGGRIARVWWPCRTGSGLRKHASLRCRDRTALATCYVCEALDPNTGQEVNPNCRT